MSLSTTPQNTLWKAITASASACRLSAESGGARAIQLRRRSTAVWRSCQRRDTGSSIGSCKRSLQDVRPSPVGPGKDLLSSNERRSILATPNGTLRNCVVSGANWPLATTRDLRLAGSIFSVRSNYRTDKRARRGRSGPRPALLLLKSRSGERRPRGGPYRPFTRNFEKALRPSIYGWPSRCRTAHTGATARSIRYADSLLPEEVSAN